MVHRSTKNDLKLPVKFIGVGEGIDDLQPFSATAFASSLLNDRAEMVHRSTDILEKELLKLQIDDLTPYENNPRFLILTGRTRVKNILR